MDRENVYKNVVRIICCKDIDNPLSECSLGTGFFIDKNVLITARHVIQKHYSLGYAILIEPINLGIDRAVEGIPVPIEDPNCLISLIKIGEDMQIEGLKFTSNYKIKEGDNWYSFGHPQIKWNKGHVQEGKVSRLLNSLNSENADLDLALFDRINNYKGFSGSPLIINGLVVGVIQEQAISGNEAQSLGAISIDLIIQYVPEQYLVSDIHKEELKNIFRQYTEMQINRNIRNKKYIPDVFVEIGDIKEKSRYITDPALFWEKIIEDIERFKFNGVNSFLERFALNPVETQVPESFKINNKFYNIEPKAKELIEILNNVIIELNGLNKQNLLPKVKEELRHDFIESSYKLDMPRFEWKLKEFVDLLKSFSYNILLLTENAGQGKTNFVCDLTQNVLLKKDIICIYFNASEFSDWNIKKYMEERVLNKHGYKFEDAIEIVREICIEENKPFVFVIDGLNENSNIGRFKVEIENFIEEVCQNNFIKVIMTCRSEYFNERFGNLIENAFSNKLLHIEKYNRGLGDSFKKRLFDGYMKFFRIKFSSITEDAYKKLTDDILLFRIFCEAYGDHQADKETTLPPLYDIYKFEVFEKYYQYKIDEIQKKDSSIPGVDNSVLYKTLVSKIMRYMIDNRVFSRIPKEIVNVENEIKLLRNLIDEDIIFRQDISLEKGLFTETQETISFTFDEFRDYCISRSIMEKFGSINENEYCDIIASLTEKDCEVAEGVAKYLFFASKKYQKEDFDKVLMAQDWYGIVYGNNIFGVSDKYITKDDMERIAANFTRSVNLSGYIISKLIYRYDTITFKNFNTDLLFNLILDLDEQQFRELIEPVFEPEYEENRYYSYRTSKDHITVPINKFIERVQYELNEGKEYCHVHNVISLLILISDIDYCCIDFIESYFERFPERLINEIERLSEFNNDKLNSNIYCIIRSISSLDIRLDKTVEEKLAGLLSKYKSLEPEENIESIKGLLESLWIDFGNTDNE